MDSLPKKIISTLTYYDIMDFPMTSFEIWKYLIGNQEEKEIAMADVIRELEGEKTKKHTEEYRGFYFLKGRKELVEKRLENNKISEIKFKKIRRAVVFLKFCPFVRMIAVTGTVAMKNADKKSDLDLLIAIEKGHMFCGRILVTLIAQILKKRRHKDKITDRLCLNYFVTTDSLEIDLKDIFSSSEYSFAFPLFGMRYFRKFQERNKWIGNWKANFSPDKIANLKLVKDTNFSLAFRGLGEKILGFETLEKALKKWQLARIMKDPRTYKAGSVIIADEDSLVFLPDPQGPKIFEKFKKKLENLS